VAAIVAAGGRVHEVGVGRTSLEDRFLRLVGGVALTSGTGLDGTSPAGPDPTGGSR
jgi:hypothetical protein